MANNKPQTPPYQLEGLRITGGWTVGALQIKGDNDTGGHFSAGYSCLSDAGTKAFLKAIDLYTPIMSRGGDVIKALQPLIEGVQGERDILAECRHMDRVVTAIATGDIHEIGNSKLLIPVPYIIFERAEFNARQIVFGKTRPTHGWCLRTLHQIAVGLWQLHGSMIAHQDVKLSNVLLFLENKGAKLSDLGRAVRQGRSLPHDALEWPGDNAYAPPEYVYGYTPAEFNIRRLASDLYLLGSCACSIFTNSSMNALLYADLPRDLHPMRLRGSYTGTFAEALPHLQDAFERVLAKISESIPADSPIKVKLLTMIKEWCEPDPLLRGHPQTRAINSPDGNIYSLERYLNQLDLLATKAAIYERVKGR
jgi:eukaryotic-like serine/threonine-protein kinase